MKIGIDTAGQRWAVDINPGDASTGRSVTINGRVCHLDAVRTGRAWSLLVDGRSYEVALVDQPDGSVLAQVNGHGIPALVTGGGARFGATAARLHAGDQNGGGAGVVVAPMPGRVVKVLVSVGDTVGVRQGLVVVEAMKMENELRSSTAGLVTAVHVAEGALVEAGTVLVTVE